MQLYGKVPQTVYGDRYDKRNWTDPFDMKRRNQQRNLPSNNKMDDLPSNNNDVNLETYVRPTFGKVDKTKRNQLLLMR